MSIHCGMRELPGIVDDWRQRVEEGEGEGEGGVRRRLRWLGDEDRVAWRFGIEEVKYGGEEAENIGVNKLNFVLANSFIPSLVLNI